MKKSTTVFGNLLSHFPRSEFEKSVQTLKTDSGVRTLSSYELLKTLVYGQIINAFSVREIESSLAANSSSLYQCGLKTVKRSTFCDALEKRDSSIFETAFQALVFKAQQMSSTAGRRFKNPLKVIDASTIELCLSRFDWAKFRSTKGAVKIHVSLNGDCFFPEQVRMTCGAVHEVKELNLLSQESKVIYTFDRGYVNFKVMHDIHLKDSIFVTRMKKNCDIDIVKPRSISEKSPVRLDASVRLVSQKARDNYPEDLRMISYHDDENDKDYIFMTNSFDHSGQEIADIYKARWQVELFFKWIKQNLKIKTFLGTSQNAVYTQLWVGMIVFMLLWIQKNIESLSVSSQRLIQILKTSILRKCTIVDLFKKSEPPDKFNSEQLRFIGL